MNFFGIFNGKKNDDSYQKDEQQQNQQNNDAQKTTSSTNHSYFEKKGEVNELRKLLKDLMEKAPVKDDELQEAMKKVIGVMTLGIDLSSIFTEILMFSYTNDIVSKKMIYLYLSNYAKTNKETAIMAINTFMKDCKNPDGKIRGYALKTLCQLQTPTSLEYVKQQILELIEDRDPYVRKIAVMGCLRLYYQDYQFFNDHMLIDKLYNLLKDPHKSVVMCAINVLNEIMISEGGMAINNKIILYLLNRFNEFDSYGQQTILGLLVKYEPQSQEELYDLMNLLEDNLKKNNKPLILAIINVFLKITKNDKDIFEKIQKHLAPKLIILYSASQNEECFNILKHILLFCQSTAIQYFRDNYQLFYCRAYEKVYNQKLKIDILVQLSNKFNIDNIIEEFSEYATEKNSQYAQNAILGLSQLLKKFPEKNSYILKRMLILLKIGDQTIISKVLQVIQELCSVQQQIPSELETTINHFMEKDINNEIACHLLQIISQRPKQFEVSPYLCEYVLDLMIDEKFKYSKKLLQIYLNSIIRIFLVRPGEALPILTKFYSFIYSEKNAYVNDIDLIERANFYYNLMKNDINALVQQFNTQKQLYGVQQEDFEKQLLKYGMNDLRIIYKKPASKFIKDLSYFQQEQKLQDNQKSEEDADSFESEEEESQPLDKKDNKIQEEADFLGTDFGQQNENGPTFQQKWHNIQSTYQDSFSLIQNEQEPNYYEKVFNKINIQQIASGKKGDCLKFFLYAKSTQETKEDLLLLEINFDYLNMTVHIKMKNEKENIQQEHINKIKEHLKTEQIIA